MYNAIFCVSSYAEEYTLNGMLSKFCDNKESHVVERKYFLGCLSNRNKGMVSCCISMFGFREYLLENDCYASLAGVLIRIQYGSVSKSRQLLRCMGTRLNLIEGGGDITGFCLAVPKRLAVGRWNFVTLSIIIKAIILKSFQWKVTYGVAMAMLLSRSAWLKLSGFCEWSVFHSKGIDIGLTFRWNSKSALQSWSLF